MTRYIYIYLIAVLLTGLDLAAQYPPPAGQPGSTALHKDSALFVDWAANCILSRGYMNIADTTLGKVFYGLEYDATGAADNMVVSLGDSGVVVITFNFAIFNGPGPDFAIFENSFTDDYLELAHVEVSSDGSNYFRFESTSLTDTITQTGSFGTTDATKIHNLAGKYKANYGTPFDLQELDGNTLLDINNITHVKIIDVVGAIDDQYATRDANGKKINDPWPTGFESGGFDLDAVGVINSKCNGISPRQSNDLIIHHNSSDSKIFIESKKQKISEIYICDLSGRIIKILDINSMKTQIDISYLNSGLYSLRVICGNIIYNKKFIKANN